MRDDEGVGGSGDRPRDDDPEPDGPEPDDRAPTQSESQAAPQADVDDGAGSDPDPASGGPNPPGDGGVPGTAVDGRSRGEAGREHPPGPEDSAAESADGPGWLLYAYDLVSSIGVVVLIGGLLFAASGVWPPMVAVQSGSMEPVMERGDLVYVMEGERFPGPGSQGETGVVTAERGRETGYQQFGGYGDVVVYQPDGNERRVPIIHRAMLWVEEDERWVDRANPAYLGGADSCSDLPDDICPAPHAGFITKGDANGGYDQVSGIAGEPVKPEWVIGTAELHVPYLGQIRLGSSGLGASANATARAGATPAHVTATPAPVTATAEPTTTGPDATAGDARLVP